MIIFQKTGDIKKFVNHFSDQKKVVGFVPTMGALHEGHASLMHLSKKENDITIVSIFVNPLQFNDRTDFEKYPITTESDVAFLEKLDIDVLFLPAQEEIFPHKDSVNKEFNLGNIESVLEGASRPGHFQGVARVMDILLNIIKPDKLYLGQKDFQQVKVIQRLIELQDSQVKIIAAPVIREESGLAMSSRNERLSVKYRKKAALIFENLRYIQQHADKESFQKLKNKAVINLESAGFKIDYLVLANQETLEVINNFDRSVPMILLAAIHVDNIRLIDNLPISI